MTVKPKTIKEKKELYRRQYIKLLIGQHEERQEILKQELISNQEKIDELWEEFNRLKAIDHV